LHEFLTAHQDKLCQTCCARKETNILRVFDCKVETCAQLYESAPQITNYLTPESQAEWQALQSQLLQLSITFTHNPYLVRGLDYYNKTVFEFIGLTLGAQSTFCGGGRYDSLAQQLGSKEEIPAIGAGIGMERLLMVLQDSQEQLQLSLPALVCCIPCDDGQQGTVLLLAESLQAAGVCVDVIVDTGSLKNKLKKAHKLQARYAMIVGQDEQLGNFVMMKDMISGNDQKVSQADLVDYCKKLV